MSSHSSPGDSSRSAECSNKERARELLEDVAEEEKSCAGLASELEPKLKEIETVLKDLEKSDTRLDTPFKGALDEVLQKVDRLRNSCSSFRNLLRGLSSRNNDNPASQYFGQCNEDNERRIKAEEFVRAYQAVKEAKDKTKDIAESVERFGEVSIIELIRGDPWASVLSVGFIISAVLMVAVQKRNIRARIFVPLMYTSGSFVVWMKRKLKIVADSKQQLIKLAGEVKDIHKKFKSLKIRNCPEEWLE